MNATLLVEVEGMRFSGLRVPGAGCLVLGAVLGAWCLVPCLVLGAWCRAGCLVLRAVLGAWCFVLCCVLGASCFVVHGCSLTLQRVTGTRTLHQAPGTA